MEIEEVKGLYLDICNGYNEIEIDNSIYYFKHHDYFDRARLNKIYKRGLQIAKENGIKTSSESADFYIEKGWWSSDKEKEISSISAFIDGLKKGRDKMLLESQKEQSSLMIQEQEKKLSDLLSEKRSIIPITAEEYADKYHSRYYLYESIFKDSNFAKKISDSEDFFTEMEDDLYSDTWSKAYDIIKKFTIDNIKYVSATGFFQNLISICGDSSFYFYGKPVVDLTLYQHDLFFYASRYKKIISNTTENIPNHILSDPKSLISWCEGGIGSSAKAKTMMDKTPNKNKTKGERSGRISSIVGATGSDYRSLGMKDSGSGKGNLLEEADSSGGSLDISKVIKKTDSFGI